MTFIRYASFMLLAALAGCGKDPPAPVPPPTGSAVAPDDATRIRGQWIASSVRREEGKPEEVPNDYTLRLDNGNYTMQFGDSNESGKYTLLPTVSPKQIDLATSEGELRKGIYVLDGDRLTICTPDQPGAPRPTEIKAHADENRVAVITFTRTK